jgi:peptidoglycan/LPS O-acetylase OafA/YrhL
MQINKSSNHFPWLDLIRFLAAFIVLVVHARHFAFVDYGMLPSNQKTLMIAGLFAVSRIGSEAVIMFFVLSGFLVGGLAFTRIKDRSFKVIDYSVDRFSRIMTPLFPALILSGLIGWIVDGEFLPWDFIGNLLSLQGVLVPVFGGNGPLWSLSYEVWFYILMSGGALLAFQGSKQFLGAFIIILFMIIFTKLSVVYWFCWIIGAMAFVFRPSRFSFLLLSSSVFLTFVAVILVELAMPTNSLNAANWRAFIPSIEMSRLLLAIGMALLLQQMSLFNTNNLFLVRIDSMGTSLAAFAYTLYLTHYPLLHLGAYWGVKRSEFISADAVWVFLFEIFMCMVAAWLIYMMFEKHTVKVRRWIKAQLI